MQSTRLIFSCDISKMTNRLNVYISYEDSFTNENVDIQVYPSYISFNIGSPVEVHEHFATKIVMPNHIELIPNSFSMLNGSTFKEIKDFSDGLCRLYLTFGIDIKTFDSNHQLLNEMAQPLKIKSLLNIEAKAKYNLYCQKCDFLLNKELSFDEVLSMPSEAWKEFGYNDSFCHLHCSIESNGPESENLKNGSLYVDMQYFIMKINNRDNYNEEKNQLACKSCLTSIGHHDPIATYFYQTKVQFKNNNSLQTVKTSESSHSPLEYILCLLKEQTFSTLTTILCLESKELDLCVYICVLGIIEYFRDEWNHKSNPEIKSVTFKSFTKVLYAIVNSQSKEAAGWKKDFSIYYDKIDKDTLLSLIQVLTTSTEPLMPSLRRNENLMIGFIPMLES